MNSDYFQSKQQRIAPENLLFSFLNLPMLNSLPVLHSLRSIPESKYFFDPYRNTFMLSIFTDEGSIQKVRNRGLAKKWTQFACKELRTYFEQHIFPWMEPLGRIMILKTPPKQENYIHIDCNKASFGYIQHKFRIVLQGTTDSLYFLTKSGKVYIPRGDTGRPYIIDGSWPHGMENTTNTEKYTLCLGAPWTGREQKYYDILQNYSMNHLWKQDYQLPDHFEQFFRTKEMKKHGNLNQPD